MEIQVTKGEKIEKAVVPKRVYKAVFINVKEDIPDGEYGPRIGFAFKIKEGDHAGVELTTIANNKFTENTRAGKILASMLGRELVGDEKVDLALLYGKVYEVLTETLHNDYGDYSVVSEVIRLVDVGTGDITPGLS